MEALSCFEHGILGLTNQRPNHQINVSALNETVIKGNGSC